MMVRTRIRQAWGRFPQNYSRSCTPCLRAYRVAILSNPASSGAAVPIPRAQKSQDASLWWGPPAVRIVPRRSSSCFSSSATSASESSLSGARDWEESSASPLENEGQEGGGDLGGGSDDSGARLEEGHHHEDASGNDRHHHHHRNHDSSRRWVPLHAPLDAKIRYLRSAVPLGHMTMEEYELGLETIRWVEQDQLRTQTRRSRRSRSHDLNLWRGAYDVLHRLECEQDARREKNRALQRRRWKTLPSFPELNTTPYNRLLRYLARIPNLEPDKKVQVAEDFLQRMTDLSSLVSARSFDGLGGSVVPCPDRHTYHAFFYVCVATSREHPANSQIALQKAQALLQRLESESGATNCWSIEDGENDNDSEMAQKSGYDAIIQIHSNQASDVYGAAAAAEDALLRLSHRSTSRPRLQPTAETFNRVLKAWSACRETKGADRAHEILKLQLSLGPPASPDQVSFGTVMAAYGKRRRPEEAQTIWEECVRFLGRAGSANAADRDRIDLTGCFEVLVSAWARSMLPEAVIRIKDLIRTVVHGSHDSFVVRDTAVIHSRLVQTMVAKRKVVAAHEHLLEMVERSRQGSGPVPMARAFNCVFVGWKNAVLAEPWQALLAAQRSMELLRVMMSAGGECSTDPNTFYLITDVLCHALEASTDLQVERSEEVSSIVQDGFLEILGHAEQRKQVRGVMYHRIIHSLCRHATPETSTMASLVLNQYYEQARRQWDVEWIPNQTVGLYTTVFAALARIKSVEATERALELFRVMSALKGDSGRDLALVPTVRTYTSALQAVSWLRNNRSAQVASEMFEKLKLLDADPNYHVKFDGIVFAVLLEASVADSDLCCRIFSEIVQLRRSGRTNLDEIARYQATVVQALVHGGQSERDALEKVATICASM